MNTIPKVIIHNSVSLDGSLTGFMPDMGIHYQLAGSYNPDIHLIGSDTIIAGIEMFGGVVPPEEPSDFIKPARDEKLPIWAIVDSGGRLAGLHHTSRRFEFCRDVVVLISRSTSPEYKEHLRKRNYDTVITGSEKVDLPAALTELSNRYSAKTILTDTGAVLGNLLLESGLVTEISMLIHPLITGNKGYNMFAHIKEKTDLELIHREEFEQGLLWLIYRVRNPRTV